MASLIANEFSEASGDLHLSALMAVGFTLFVITLDRERDRPLARVAGVAQHAGERDMTTPASATSAARSGRSSSVPAGPRGPSCAAATWSTPHGRAGRDSPPSSRRCRSLIILFHLIEQGGASLQWHFFTNMPKPVGETGGGMANAIVGTADPRRARQSHRLAGRHRRGPLSGRALGDPARQYHALSGRRAQRAPVDRDGHSLRGSSSCDRSGISRPGPAASRSRR